MCGRFDTLVDWGFVHDLMGLEPQAIELAFMPKDHRLSRDPYSSRTIVPSLMAPILRRSQKTTDVSLELERIEARFGLIPHWYQGRLKDFKTTSFNARIETIGEKPVFRQAYEKRRSLIPMAGFYEWSGSPKARQKWWVTSVTNEPLLAAGIWDQAICEGEKILSFALLTHEAKGALKAIHHRSPLFLRASEALDYLKGHEPERDQVIDLKLEETPSDSKDPQISLF